MPTRDRPAGVAGAIRRVCSTAGLLAAALCMVQEGPLAAAERPVGGAVGGAAEQPEKKPARTVDADQVYAGDPKADWQKPACVDPDRVFAEIEEYRKILEDRLEPSDPKYQVLMSKASRRFSTAVRAAAKDGSWDLVARVGAVHGVDHVPDITTDVIKKL